MGFCLFSLGFCLLLDYFAWVLPWFCQGFCMGFVSILSGFLPAA
jgi:hypothetical protein